MSLLGKILAILNVLAAAAVVYLAAADYGKRRAWSYALLRQELVLTGLPVDADEVDQDGVPVADKLTPETLRDLFSSVGGDEQPTQEAEVARIQRQLQGRIPADPKNRREQIVAYARYLTPLARTLLDREQLLGYRIYLADDKSAAAVRDNYARAFRDAAKAKGQNFEAAFRQNLRDRFAEPSEAFTLAFLQQLPANPAGANFDQAWDKSLEAQRARLEAQFQEAFAEPLRGQATVGGSPRPVSGKDQRRTAIARLLFALCPVLAEDEVAGGRGGAEDQKLLGGLPPGSAAYEDRVLDTGAYQKAFARMQVVCGLRSTADAVGEQAEVMQAMARDITSELARERSAFVQAHQDLVEKIVEAAARFEREQAELARERDRVSEHNKLVNKREDDLKEYRAELQKAQARTAKAVKELKDLTEELFKRRLAARDALSKNAELEEKIRELEKKAREAAKGAEK